jgi:hypothetical protein
MPAATAEWPGVRRLRFRHLGRLATSRLVSWWWIICTFSLNPTLGYTFTLDLAVSGTRRPEIIRRVRQQQWCLLVFFLLCKYCLLFWSLWELHIITVSSSFPLLSNEVGSTLWSNNIWDTSDRSRLLGGYNRNLPRCGFCGKVGHWRNKCFAREKGEARVLPVVTNAPESCFRCGENDHLAGHCRKFRITQVERKIWHYKSR